VLIPLVVTDPPPFELPAQVFAINEMVAKAGLARKQNKTNNKNVFRELWLGLAWLGLAWLGLGRDFQKK